MLQGISLKTASGRQNFIILLLIICSLAVRLVVFINTDNSDGIAMGRVVNALNILEDPALRSNFDPNVSVLYNYSLAAVLRFWPDPLNGPRVFTMFFGVFSVIPFYFLIKLLFNERIALFSVILLILDPFHIMQSVLSTSDAAFYLFFLSSLYYLFKFNKQKSNFAFILALVLFNVASLLRFESWIFIPVLSLFLFRNRKRYVLMFFFFSLILPSLWLYLCHHFFGDVLYSFRAPANTMHIELTMLNRVYYVRSIYALGELLADAITPAVTILGLCGILYAVYEKKHLQLALLFALLYCLFTVNMLFTRMWFNYRSTIFLGILIMPYAVYIIEKLAVRIRVNSIILLLFFTLLCVPAFQEIINKYLPSFKLSRGIEELATKIRVQVKPGEKVMLVADELDVFDQDIIVRSGLPPRIFSVISTISCVTQLNTKKDIREYILSFKPDYLVWSSDSCLQKKVNLDLDKNTLKDFGWRLELIASQPVFSRSSGMQKYNIYKINYSQN
ncbi:MAG: glycosyltransferase family 39 protein [Candidatus Omnitrophota bacterium]